MAKKLIKKSDGGGSNVPNDTTAWKKKTFPKLSKQGLDYEIGRLSKMVTPKSAPSVIQQKIDMLKREKIRRTGTPGQTIDATTPKNKMGGSIKAKTKK